MPDDSCGSITVLIQQLQHGDATAARDVWMRYFPRLSGLARTVLHQRHLPQTAEDAVQDAFFSFFRQIEHGEIAADGMRREDLWRVLSLITVNAAKKLIVRENALKRGGGRVVAETDALGKLPHSVPLAELVTTMPTAVCDAICSEFLENLDDDLREIALATPRGLLESTNQDDGELFVAIDRASLAAHTIDLE